MAFIEGLSINQKISVIRSINYDENLSYKNVIPSDILKSIFKMSSSLLIPFFLKFRHKNSNLICIYIDPRLEIYELYKAIYQKLYEKSGSYFFGIYRARISVNSYQKVFTVETKGKISDYINKGDTVEFIGSFPCNKTQIFVKGDKTYVFNVNLYWPTDYLLSQITEKIKVPKCDLIVTYASKNLHLYPYMPLYELGIRKECTIFMKVR